MFPDSGKFPEEMSHSFPWFAALCVLGTVLEWRKKTVFLCCVGPGTQEEQSNRLNVYYGTGLCDKGQVV